MTTYAFPSVVPTNTEIKLESNTGAFVSPYTGSTQTFDRGGERWLLTLNFESLVTDNRAVMQAFLARLNGQQHRFTIENHANPARGAFGGTPLVSGAAQTGSSIDIDGASTSVTNWIRAGDYFSVDGALKVCTVDADSSGGGLVTINFSPRIQVAPADNAPIITSNATGTFMLAENTVTWTNRPGGFMDLSFSAIEDILI